MLLRRPSNLILLLAAAVLLATPALAEARRTLLVTNGDSSSIGAFDVAADGSLTPFPGSPFPTGAQPNGVAISPDGRFAFVANNGDDSVRPFVIGDLTLTQASGSVATGGNSPTALTITPDGQRLIVAHRNNNSATSEASVFNINQTSGTLSVATIDQDIGFSDLTGVAVARDGKHAYFIGRNQEGPPVTNAYTRIGVVTINASGSLTPILGSPFVQGTLVGGFGLTVSPDGSRLFGSSSGAGLLAYNLNETTGAIAAVPGSPFPVVGGSPQQGILTPSGQRLYANAPVADAVLGFNIDQGVGSPSAIPGSPFGAGNNTSSLAIAADGKMLYSPRSTNPTSIAGFSIDGAGALAALPGSPVTVSGSDPSFYSAALTPTQTPEATIGVTPATAGSPTAFNATASARGGLITRYDWDFGDGTTAANSGATPTHAYTKAGTYTATLTVRNDCDPNAVFENDTVFVGRVTYCKGTPTTSVKRDVAIADAASARVEILTSRTSVPGTRAAKRSAAAKKKKSSGKRGRAAVRLRCVAVATTKCAGTVSIVSRAKKPKTLGKKTFSILAGKTGTVRIKLRKASQRKLRRSGKLNANTVASTKQSLAGIKPIETKRKLTLRARR